MRTMRSLLVLASSLLATAAFADTIQATSTTYVSAGQQNRGGLPGEKPDVVDVIPVIEVLSISASGVRNPLFDDLSIVLSTWGSAELADNRWDAGTSGELTGDVMTGYLSGKLWKKRLTLRLGRQAVAVGAGRMASIDGGDVTVRLPAGFVVEAYAGAPVAQRFGSRSGLVSWNPLGGDLAFGGRLGWAHAFGSAMGLDVGASAAMVDDDGEWARRDVGLDARLRLGRKLSINGSVLAALVEGGGVAEATALATWQPSRHLFVTADYRHTAPNLMLPQTSILTVFADATRDDVGGGVRYELTRTLEVGVDYHALLEPDGEEGTELGHEATVRGDYRTGTIRAGAELTYLSALENGYLGGRAFVRRDFGRLYAVGDFSAYVFDEPVNDQEFTVGFGATAGYKLSKGWTAAVTGSAAATPFMESKVDVMAKLAYNQVYRVREVR